MYIDDNGVIVGPMLRTRYNYDVDAASVSSGLLCADPTRTQQQFKEECDINTIVRNFGVTGMLPQNVRMPLTNEFVEAMDYQTAMNKIIEADQAFLQLPAEVRDTFRNDAGKFVEFATDPKNVDQCRKWGLAIALSTPVVEAVAPVVPTT